MENIKRPSIKETEEDLLKEQELFLKNKAKLPVNIRKNDSLEIFSEKNVGTFEETRRSKQKDDPFIIHEEEVLFDVQERPVSEEPFIFKLPSVTTDEVFNMLNENIFPQNTRKQKGRSIFAQIVEKDKKHFNCKNSSSSTVPETISCHSSIDSNDFQNVLTEARGIHEENKKKIAAMSKEEIQKNIEELKRHLDPSIIQFLQSKKKLTNCKSSDNKPASKFINNRKIDKFSNQNSDEYKILKKEGKEDCDALLLTKSFDQESEVNEVSITSSHNNNKEIPETTMKLIEDSKKGKWKNMNKIEKDKLEWLSELPKPNPVNLKTGYTTRFDFEGKLLSHDIDIPTYKGLHHHGEEPEVAGYSLEELFLLARSTLQSQRITALHTLAHILDNYWYGMMDSCFDRPLLLTLLDAGIVPLLRWALDDSSVMSVAATVTAIHSLLICKADEACLQKTFCWLNGHLLPMIEPSDLEEPNLVIEELSDADLIKLDVIKGFFRMDTLPRFLYVLQTMQPSPDVCKLIIEILCHLAQHSKNSAYEVAKFPGLLDIIFKKFLPIAWQYVDGGKLTDTVNYCCPLPSAMKLIRIIASSCKELACYIVENYEIEYIISVYLTLHPTDGKLTLLDVQNIMIETLKTHYVFLCNGFGCQIFLDLYPIFLRQMEFFISLSMKADEKKHCKDFEYASYFFKLLEPVVILSSQSNESLKLKTLLNAIFNQSLLCLKKWFHEFKQEKPCDSAMTLLATTLNFVSIFYQKSHERLTCDHWEPCSIVKEMYTSYLIPAIKSNVFKCLLHDIQSFSLLLDSGQSGNKRDGRTIVSLGSVLWESDVVPFLKKGTPMPLLLSVCNFIYVYQSLFNDEDNQLITELLVNSPIMEYLRKISTNKLNHCSWFDRFEVCLIALLLKLSPYTPLNNFPEWHKAAVSLLPSVKVQDDYIVRDLFKTIIFNEAFLPKASQRVVADILSFLPVIADCYISYFLNSKPSSEFYLLCSSSTPKYILPKYWCYAPIYDLYHNLSISQTSEMLTAENLLLVTSSLQWLFLCHELPLSLLKNLSGSAEFCYLSMVFLLDGDCFRCPKLAALLEANFKSVLKLKKLNFSKVPKEHVNSFNDLYLELLNQYEAVSYGDILFGNCILIPLQQCYSNQWKKLLLTDHSGSIAFLRVPLSKLLMPLKNYLEPYEDNYEVLKNYLILLKNGYLNYQRCPLLYLMAIHHINHFIFLRNPERQKCQKFLILNITAIKKEVLKLHILLYLEANVQSELGFTLKEELSENDSQHLKNIMGKDVI